MTNWKKFDIIICLLGWKLSKKVKRERKEEKEREKEERKQEIDNVYLTRFDIERILLMLDEKDKVERIYINFCNPWPRGKHHKKRLTHTRQLEKYKEFLVI